MTEQVTPEDTTSSRERLIVSVDHWTDAGGQTVGALKDFLSEETGTTIEELDAVVVDTVEDMRKLVLGTRTLHL